MNRYLYQSNKSFDQKLLENIFFSFDINPGFNYLSPTRGLIETEAKLDDVLAEKAYAIHEQLGVNIAFLRVNLQSELSLRLIGEALAYYPNAFRYMSDILFKELTFGNFSAIPLLYREFSKVPKELLGTIGAYLRSGLDGSLASKSLYIHRNTFLWRLDKFIKLTNLDVRDYHDALLVELYFQMAEH